jgi:hypothetical protein
MKKLKQPMEKLKLEIKENIQLEIKKRKRTKKN